MVFSQYYSLSHKWTFTADITDPNLAVAYLSTQTRPHNHALIALRSSPCPSIPVSSVFYLTRQAVLHQVNYCGVRELGEIFLIGMCDSPFGSHIVRYTLLALQHSKRCFWKATGPSNLEVFEYDANQLYRSPEEICAMTSEEVRLFEQRMMFMRMHLVVGWCERIGRLAVLGMMAWFEALPVVDLKLAQILDNLICGFANSRDAEIKLEHYILSTPF